MRVLFVSGESGDDDIADLLRRVCQSRGVQLPAGQLLVEFELPQLGRPIKAIGAATTASPAPKVFTSHRGLETFSTQFTLEWETRDGVKQTLPLTPELYQRVRGPYNRRNVFGAVLAYGPVLLTDEATHEMFKAASRYALAGDAPLLRELGVNTAKVAGCGSLTGRPAIASRKRSARRV